MVFTPRFASGIFFHKEISVKKTKFLVSFALAIMILLALVGPALAGEKPVARERLMIDVLHATGSESNPYVCINVNINSVEDAANVAGHGDHDLDIWAPYTYGGVNYPGQGDRAILANGCGIISATEVPPTEVPPTEVVVEPTVASTEVVESTEVVDPTVEPTLESTLDPTQDPCQLNVSENCPPTVTPPTPATQRATVTLAPTATTPPSCTTPGWKLVGYIYGPDGQLLTTDGGNVYHVFFRVARTSAGVEVEDLGLQGYPVDPAGKIAGGFDSADMNLVRSTVAVMDDDEKIYSAIAEVIYSDTLQPLASQQEFIGTYCGQMTIRVRLLAPDGSVPVVVPTPAPLQETGAGASFGGWGLLIALMAVGAIVLMVLAASNRRAR